MFFMELRIYIGCPFNTTPTLLIIDLEMSCEKIDIYMDIKSLFLLIKKQYNKRMSCEAFR